LNFRLTKRLTPWEPRGLLPRQQEPDALKSALHRLVTSSSSTRLRRGWEESPAQGTQSSPAMHPRCAHRPPVADAWLCSLWSPVLLCLQASTNTFPTHPPAVRTTSTSNITSPAACTHSWAVLVPPTQVGSAHARSAPASPRGMEEGPRPLPPRSSTDRPLQRC
jgi:hypothetical protein